MELLSASIAAPASMDVSIPSGLSDADLAWIRSAAPGAARAVGEIVDRAISISDRIVRLGEDPGRVELLLDELEIPLPGERGGAWSSELDRAAARAGRDPASAVAVVERYRDYLMEWRGALPIDAKPVFRDDTDRTRISVPAPAADRSAEEPKPGAPGGPLRLARGEAVELSLADGDLRLWLARREFIIVRDGAIDVFIDADGRRQDIPAGRSTVGRALDADVKVDESYTDVSRTHLVIDSNDGQLRLTDVSSLGTWVSRARRAGTD